jgi:hypothetical protein
MRLDKGKFIRWLKAKPPTEIVGENRDCHACPIATFYFEASGGSEVVIFGGDFSGHVIDRGYSRRALPDWAERFVSDVDGDSDGQISAQRALRALSPAKREG